MDTKKIRNVVIGVVVLSSIGLLVAYAVNTSKFNFKTAKKNKARTGMGYQRDIRIDYKDRTLVHIGDFTANMSLGDRAGKYVRIQLSARVENSDVSDEMKEKNIIIRDNVISALSAKTFSQIATPQGKTRLKEDMRLRLNST
ncbi:MAG TPA: flagellar basal body-associated FliL family protein, partial [Helicobacteraceae bacterium]|nr:flagellar basal body-associated FliL family protein [Helicobacteraceae bacterium]